MTNQVVSALLALILTAGVSQSPVAPEMAAEVSTLEEAKAAGYVVHENRDITQGAETFEEFVRKAERGEPAKVQLAFYYTSEDPALFTTEYAGLAADEFPMLFLQELSFDGKRYTLSWEENGQQAARHYQHLLKYEGPAETRFALYTSYVRYVLTNDNTVTWEQLREGVYSSEYGSYIEYDEVYTDLIYDLQ